MRAFTFVCTLMLFVVPGFGDSAPTEVMSDEERRLNLASFDYVWTTIRDSHFDAELGGLDWNAVRAELRPRVEEAETIHDVRRAIVDMTDRLGLSHFGLIPAEAYEALARHGGDLSGVTGLDVRVVDLTALVVAVEAGSPADAAGVRPGWTIVGIDDEVLADHLPGIAAEFEGSSWKNGTLAGIVLSHLRGPVGEPVTVTFLDGNGGRVRHDIVRAEEPGEKKRFGYLPPLVARAEKRWAAPGVGYIRFNMFLDPLKVMPVFNAGMQEFMDARGIVIDLRGNGGGLPGMVLGMLGWLIEENTRTLGTFSIRGNELNLIVNARVTTYDGRVAVLTDELSGSAAELMASGLRDLGRARLFGSTTAGAVLPSMVEQLPNGDGFQYAFGHYETVQGEVLEGKGVAPHVTAPPTREALLDGRDLALEAAVDWIRSTREKGGVTMYYRMDELARLVISIITVVIGMTAASATEEATPSAEAVLDRFVDASGGQAAYDKLTNRVVHGSFQLPAQGLEGALTIWSEKPNQLYSVVESDVIGRIERGTDGSIAWEKSTMAGAVLKSGQEEADFLRDATFDRWVYWDKAFESAEMVGAVKVDGVAYYQLSMVPAEGKPQTWYFDRDSGLLARIDAIFETQMGALPVESHLVDYREVDGIRMPFEIRVRIMGQERVIRTEKVEHNVDMPADQFALPDDVQALARKKAS